MPNYWLAEPFVVGENSTWKIVAVPLRMRQEFRDYLSGWGLASWEEHPDVRPGFIEFGFEPLRIES